MVTRRSGGKGGVQADGQSAQVVTAGSGAGLPSVGTSVLRPWAVAHEKTWILEAILKFLRSFNKNSSCLEFLY